MNGTVTTDDLQRRHDGADPEAQALIMLSIHALLRSDQSMMGALMAFRHTAEGGAIAATGGPVVGIDGLLDRLRTICPPDEAEHWGGLLVLTLLGADQTRIDALLALVGRRCAN